MSKWRQALEWFERHAKTFDLFPEYTKAVYHRWNDYFFEALLLAPIVLWWMLGSPPMWLVAWAFVIALVVAGYYTWRADHLQLIPKVTLHFEHRDPFKQTTPLENVVGVKVYFRVFPKCSTPVPNCTGYLLKIFRERDGRWISTPFNEAVLLTWADGRTGPITVEPGIGPLLECFLCRF